MTNDAEHLLMDLYISFGECLFKVFTLLLIGWVFFFFLILSSKSSLSILDTSVEYIRLANIVFHFVSCLLTFWWCPMKHKSF